MRGSRRLLGAMVAVLVACPPASATAASSADFGIEFPGSRPAQWQLVSQPSRLRKKVCNVGLQRAKTLRVYATGFGFKTDKRPIREDRVVKIRIKRPSLRSGRCALVVASVARPSAVDPASYTGEFVVTSSGSGMARATIEATVPATKANPAPVEGVADPLPANGHRPGPPVFPWWRNAEVNSTLLLKSTPPMAPSVGLPNACNTSDPDDLTCPFVGNLFNGDNVAKVFVDGKPQVDPQDPITLRIRVEGATGVGVYSGPLDLAQTPSDPKDDVTVSLTVSDHWWWAVIALLLAMLVALAPQWWSRRSKPRKGFKDRVEAIPGSYFDAESAFHANAPTFRGLHSPPPPPGLEPADVGRDYFEFTDYIAALDEAIARYNRSTIWFDPESSAYKEIEESLKLVERDIACWRQKTRLAAGLTSMRDKLAENAAFVKDELHSAYYPAIGAPFVTLLADRSLKIGEALLVEKQIANATTVLDDWRALADRYLRCLLRLAALLDPLKPQDIPELPHLAAISDDLTAVHERLFAAKDGDDLKRRRIDELLDKVEDQLGVEQSHGHTVLRGGERELVQPRPVNSAFLGTTLRFTGVLSIAGVLEDRVEIPPESLSKITRQASAPDVGSAGATKVRQRKWGRLADAAVLLFTVATSFLVAFFAVYYPGPFGTTKDYVTIVIIGAVAQVALQAILSAIRDVLPKLPDQVIRKTSVASLLDQLK